MTRAGVVIILALGASFGCSRSTPQCLENAPGDGGAVRNLSVNIDGLPMETDGGAVTTLHIVALVPCFSQNATTRAAVTLSDGMLSGTSAQQTGNFALVTLTPADPLNLPGVVDGFVNLTYPGTRDVRVTVVVGDASALFDVPAIP